MTTAEQLQETNDLLEKIRAELKTLTPEQLRARIQSYCEKQEKKKKFSKIQR